VSANPAQVRKMLATYGRQLTSAKRLARFRRALRLSQAQDAVSISRQARRRQLVERIAKEVVENLIVNGTYNPVVTDILEALRREVGERFVFEYPLDGEDLRLLRETKDGVEEVAGEPRERVLRKLWEITLTKVDETML